MIHIRTYKHPKKQDQPLKHSILVMNGKGLTIGEHVNIKDDVLFTLLRHYQQYSNSIYHVYCTHVRELTFKEGLRM